MIGRSEVSVYLCVRSHWYKSDFWCSPLGVGSLWRWWMVQIVRYGALVSALLNHRTAVPAPPTWARGTEPPTLTCTTPVTDTLHANIFSVTHKLSTLWFNVFGWVIKTPCFISESNEKIRNSILHEENQFKFWHYLHDI